MWKAVIFLHMVICRISHICCAVCFAVMYGLTLKQGLMKIKRHRRIIIFVSIGLLIILLNAAAWNSRVFSDWYIANIFPIWVNLYGRVTGIFPFSVGEWMLGAGVVLVAFALLLGLLCALMGAACGIRRLGRICGAGQSGSHRGQTSGAGSLGGAAGGQAIDEGGTEDMVRSRAVSGGFWRFAAGFYRFFVWTLLTVCLVMTLNCFILYHASTFSEHYFGEDDGEYDLTELIAVYNIVAEKCNELAAVMERDEAGRVIYTGSGGELKDAEYRVQLDALADRARELMRQLGKTYPQLDGFYPRPKALLTSDFMCQQYMKGYYFPFSMEANYNDVMQILNMPETMCHELAHLRGYIFEDEANFIAYLACTQSDDLFFQYSGYLGVLVYLNNDIYRAWEESRVSYEEAVAVVQPVAVDSQVWADDVFVTQEEWDRINGKALIDTEIVDEISDAFIDTNLKVNGVTDGAVSYSRVVRLLLQYYRDNTDL